MSTGLRNRDDLLTAVRAVRREIDDIADAAGAANSPRHRDNGSWTIEDLLAHVTGWRLSTAARLEAAENGTQPDMPWPASLEEDDDLDEINRWFTESGRGKTLAQLVQASNETFDRIERALASLPEDDLFEVNRFSWLPGDALGPAVVGGTIEHHAEHLPESRAILDVTLAAS